MKKTTSCCLGSPVAVDFSRETRKPDVRFLLARVELINYMKGGGLVKLTDSYVVHDVQ